MDTTEICADIRNYFIPIEKRDDGSFMHDGEFTISGNSISPLDFIKEGQYFRIVGSMLNDGVYCNTESGLSSLVDETFKGCIWEMAVPPTFLKMCEEITAWKVKNESPDSANMSPFTSESFAGYSYSKSGAGNNASVSWQSAFDKRLMPYRRLRVL